MPDSHRLRQPSSRRAWRPAPGALALSLLVLALSACNLNYPNTTLVPHSEFGRAIDHLWRIELTLGTLVFIFVEGLLVIAIIRFRERPGQPPPEHVHGNPTLEILWTVIPIIVLLFIAVPTARTTFATQRPAPANAVEIDVYGHQWWWEFQYPQYHVTTANEIYLPLGRPVNFVLRSKDVLHSFWIPQLGGKRDVITNHTNYLWFTPDSNLAPTAWNGECAEYCGTNHGIMHFRAYTVPESDFEQWAAWQAKPAAFPPPPPPGAGSDSGYRLPANLLKRNNTPETPLPGGMNFATEVNGDPTRGHQLYSQSACIACHTIRGNPTSVGQIGPDLTHIASRYTIGAALYPNDTRHLERWIKNAREMKNDVLMPTLGAGQYDPTTKSRVPAATGMTDQQIADIVAYLQQLK